MMKLRIDCKTKLKVVELNNEFSSMHNIVVIVDQMHGVRLLEIFWEQFRTIKVVQYK